MKPIEDDERLVDPSARPAPVRPRLAKIAAGAAVLIAIVGGQWAVERTGVTLSFAALLGGLVVVAAGSTWLLLTGLDWLGWSAATRIRTVASGVVFVLGVLTVFALGTGGHLTPPGRPLPAIVPLSDELTPNDLVPVLILPALILFLLVVAASLWWGIKLLRQRRER